MWQVLYKAAQALFPRSKRTPETGFHPVHATRPSEKDTLDTSADHGVDRGHPCALQDRKAAILFTADKIERTGSFQTLITLDGLSAPPTRQGIVIRRRIRHLQMEEALGPWWQPSHQYLFALAIVAARRFAAQDPSASKNANPDTVFKGPLGIPANALRSTEDDQSALRPLRPKVSPLLFGSPGHSGRTPPAGDRPAGRVAYESASASLPNEGEYQTRKSVFHARNRRPPATAMAPPSRTIPITGKNPVAPWVTSKLTTAPDFGILCDPRPNSAALDQGACDHPHKF